MDEGDAFDWTVGSEVHSRGERDGTSPGRGPARTDLIPTQQRSLTVITYLLSKAHNQVDANVKHGLTLPPDEVPTTLLLQ